MTGLGQRSTPVIGEEGAATARARRLVLIGVIGALAFIAGVGLYVAMSSPPYSADEAQHVGYALSLRQGELPRMTSPVETSGGGEHLRVALQRVGLPNTSYTAINPPFVYLVSLPFVEVAIRSGITDGPLLAFRLLDVAGAAAAVAVAYLLGRELSGGDRFVGLVTAGLLSSVIAVGVVTAGALVDGPALVATTGVTWMLARFARTRSMRDAAWLGCWSAAAAAVRPMSLAFAAGAGVLALVVGLRALGRTALIPLAIRLAAPAVLITGWFYILNTYRYGDWTGSAEAATATPAGFKHVALLTTLRDPNVIVRPFAYLIMEVYGRSPWFGYHGLRAYIVTALALGLVPTAVIVVARQSRPTHQTETAGYEPSLAAWVCVAILALAPIALIVKYVSVGGAAHPRYLLPMLPIVAAATALVTTRLNRWLAVVVVGLFAVAQLTRIRAAGNLSHSFVRFVSPQLRNALVTQPFLALSASLAIAGAVTLMICLVRAAGSQSTR